MEAAKGISRSIHPTRKTRSVAESVSEALRTRPTGKEWSHRRISEGAEEERNETRDVLERVRNEAKGKGKVCRSISISREAHIDHVQSMQELMASLGHVLVDAQGDGDDLAMRRADAMRITSIWRKVEEKAKRAQKMHEEAMEAAREVETTLEATEHHVSRLESENRDLHQAFQNAAECVMAYRKEMSEQKETIERMREFLEVHELKVYNAEQKIQALKEELASQMYIQLDDTEPSNLVLLDKQPYALDPTATTVMLQKNQKTVSAKSTTKYLSR